MWSVLSSLRTPRRAYRVEDIIDAYERGKRIGYEGARQAEVLKARYDEIIAAGPAPVASGLRLVVDNT